MIKEENEKIAICPICSETLTTNLYFASDGCLYHKNCFTKLKYKTPISRQNLSYYLPVNKVVNGKIYLEKEIKKNFEILIYDLDGIYQDGFNRKGFDRNGLNLNGIDENGFNRSEEIFIQAIRENPWNIYYVSEMLEIIMSSWKNVSNQILILIKMLL